MMLSATLASVAPIVASRAAQEVVAPMAGRADAQAAVQRSAPSATPDAAQAAPGAQPPTPKSAAAPRGQSASEVHLLGDWLGIRTALADVGLTPTALYTGQGVVAPRGGANRRAQFAGQLVLAVAADLNKMTKGNVPGTFQLGFARRHGASFNASAGLNLLVNPQSIAGRGEIWRVTQFWYRTSMDGFDLKVGHMQLNEDFNQARCDFISGYFCIGENVRVAPTAWPTTPVSQWGIRLQHAVTRGIALKVGLYQYNPKNLDVDRPLYFGLAGGTGVTIPAEITYQPRIGANLAGNYAIGVVFATEPANDPVLNTAGRIRSVFGGAPMIRNAQWGGWVNARQQLAAPRKNGSHGLSAFFNLSLFSERTASNVSAYALGMNYTGPIRGRPQDEIGIGIGRSRLNNRLTEAARYINNSGLGQIPVRTAEYAVEAYYGINVTPGLTISPDAQFVFDPAGNPNRRNVVVLGLRTTVIF